MRARAVVSLDSVPALPRHARLHDDQLRNATALLSPEKIHWPDETSLDILKACDGRASLGAIVARLAAEYDAPAEEIAGDVLAFVQGWVDRHVLTLDGGAVQPARQAAALVTIQVARDGIGLPVGMLAELTHRCPLQCPYCSNPVELLKANRELSTAEWLSIFDQAADLGVLQVHLSGGEPTLRPDLPAIVAGLSRRGVYTNLITAGVGVRDNLFADLAEAGLDHVQLSFQGARAATTEIVGNHRGGHEKKLTTARAVRAAGLPLTINAPIHRRNIVEAGEFIDLAVALDADRLEIANVQYHGWALPNRAALMPAREDVLHLAELVNAARQRLHGILEIDFVAPDYYARYPKACMGGWAKDAFMIAPDGMTMPCHAAASIPSLTFENAAETSLADIWFKSAAFNAYRGTGWMREPCRSCERRDIDFGGCRCQAMAFAGNAAEIDPACVLSPLHGELLALAVREASSSVETFVYRRIGNALPC